MIWNRKCKIKKQIEELENEIFEKEIQLKVKDTELRNVKTLALTENAQLQRMNETMGRENKKPWESWKIVSSKMKCWQRKLK